MDVTRDVFRWYVFRPKFYRRSSCVVCKIVLYSRAIYRESIVTQWGLHKLADILKKTSSRVFSWSSLCISLFLRVSISSLAQVMAGKSRAGDTIYGCPVFKWVAVIWQGTGILVTEMASRTTCSIFSRPQGCFHWQRIAKPAPGMGHG